MGWTGGTRIFDRVASIILNIDDKEEMIFELASALEELDWDTQDESVYFDHPVIGVILKGES